MIISRTPFRISFVGGGTDLKEFYHNEVGMVLSTSINKYVYVTVKEQNDLHNYKMRLSYSEVEHINEIKKIEHPIIKEVLLFLDIDEPLEITTMADVPAKTGLGSSSTFTVGLLNALHAYKGETLSKKELAEEAAHIEINLLNRPIGKQDHYAAAFGGLNKISFMSNEEVNVQPISITNKRKEKLFNNLLLFYTNITRDSSSVLNEQKKHTKDKMEFLLAMRDQVPKLDQILSDDSADLNNFGLFLDEGWQKKKELSSNISSEEIDRYYRLALEAGASGGKICGAGGGGFLMVYSNNNSQIRKNLKELKELIFSFDDTGTKIIFSE